MKPPINLSPMIEPPRREELRQRGRVRCEMLRCSMGEVLDLSVLGMKVGRKGAFRRCRGDVISMTINSPNGKLKLSVQICWSIKTGFRRWTIGVQFVDLTETAEDLLKGVARFASYRRIIPN